jgi:NADH:ubiquinone oxidoreductase subunit F (NADH-binding)
MPVCYEARRARDRLGHGGWRAPGHASGALARDWLGFMADESCGKCVPCRVGSRSAHALVAARTRESDAALLPLLEVVAAASLCAFGQSIPGPVRTILTRLDPSFTRDGIRS